MITPSSLRKLPNEVSSNISVQAELRVSDVTIAGALERLFGDILCAGRSLHTGKCHLEHGYLFR